MIMTSNKEITDQDIFIHHVFFWLKNPGNENDLKLMKEGLKKLSKVLVIRSFHIGKPAATNRDVIDNTYSLSWLLFFANKNDQDQYQKDPLHLRFIEECSFLWEKVVVYDTVMI
jgi:Stress responsive A/B Barrel Domain